MVDLDVLKHAVIDGNAARVKELTQQALDDGKGANEILNTALIKAMDIVGEKFATQEYYLPDMMIAARAMQSGLALLTPLLAASETSTRGKVVIGTVQGDLHDIGKNMVRMMLQGGGFEVVDLGVDVRPSKFVEAILEERPDLLLLCALLTTTMNSMRDTIEAVRSAGLRDAVRIGVGGAPITQSFADSIGADFYEPDAVAAVNRARTIMATWGTDRSRKQGAP